MAKSLSPVEIYEEGLRFFRGEGSMNETLRKLAEDLERRGIDYTVIGAIALNQHGYHRFTEDIDLVLNRDGLRTFNESMVGLGYRPMFEGSQKRFRATESNVPIEIVTTDEFPGDGKPKAVHFPDPASEFEVIDGVRTVTLQKLIELKLASGMTGRGRLKDLADVQELIRVLDLPREFAESLDPSVRTKFLEIHDDLAGLV